MIDLLMQSDRRYAAALAASRRARNEAIVAFARALLRLPAGGARAVGLWWRRRRLVAELRALDDLMLHDIGVFRGDIWPTVDELLRRQQSGGRIGAPAARDSAKQPETAWFGRPHRLARAPDAAQNDNHDIAAGNDPAATPSGKKSA